MLSSSGVDQKDNKTDDKEIKKEHKEGDLGFKTNRVTSFLIEQRPLLVPLEIIDSKEYERLTTLMPLMKDLIEREDSSISGAQWNVFGLYQYSLKTTESILKAIQYFEKAATLNFFEAYFNLGVIHQQGVGSIFLPHQQKASHYYQKGCELKDSKAAVNLGVMYFQDYNMAEAEKLFKMAEQNNISEAYFNLGLMYTKDTLRNAGQAVLFFEKAAEHGIPIAYILLGEIYENGMLPEIIKNKNTATQFYLQASLYGLSEGYEKALQAASWYFGKEDLLLALYKKFNKSKYNCELAKYSYDETCKIKYYEDAAKLGMPHAWYKLGEIYTNTLNRFIIDFPKGLECYEKAANLGMREGFLTLGELYSRGKEDSKLLNGTYVPVEIKKDEKKADEYYKKAIALGDLFSLKILMKKSKEISRELIMLSIQYLKNSPTDLPFLQFLMKSAGLIPELEHRIAAFVIHHLSDVNNLTSKIIKTVKTFLTQLHPDHLTAEENFDIGFLIYNMNIKETVFDRECSYQFLRQAALKSNLDAQIFLVSIIISRYKEGAKNANGIYFDSPRQVLHLPFMKNVFDKKSFRECFYFFLSEYQKYIAMKEENKESKSSYSTVSVFSQKTISNINNLENDLEYLNKQFNEWCGIHCKDTSSKEKADKIKERFILGIDEKVTQECIDQILEDLTHFKINNISSSAIAEYFRQLKFSQNIKMRRI